MRAGEVVCREGEAAGRFFVVEEGSFVVTTDSGAGPRVVGRLGPGEFFGEIALLDDTGRIATVTAESNATLWALSAAEFRAVCNEDPQLARSVAEIARVRRSENRLLAFELEERNVASLLSEHSAIGIGRSDDNAIVLPSRLVAPHHAVIEQVGEAFRLRALEMGPAVRVNAREVREADLRDGDELWIGDERLIFDRHVIRRVGERSGLRVDVRGLTRKLRDGKKILHDVTFSVLPGELVAIVGGSGAGKTTLMDAISGVRRATSGDVRYNGRDYYENMALYRSVLGYVPQDDIIHTELPLRVTLRYAARLRLPPGTLKETMDRAVDDALISLGLNEQAGLRVGLLSGGQRKRASIGVELLTEPKIFFLDEPTSGLDPATDTQMMRLARRLADDGATVFLTTHATKNVMLCDKIVFLARGGHLAYVGPPDRALEYFAATAFDEIYERLSDEATPEEWAQRFRESDLNVATEPTAWATEAADSRQPDDGASIVRSAGRLRTQLRQFAVLSARNVDVYRRNPQTLMPLVMQPLILAALLIALFQRGVFAETSTNLTSATSLVFMLTFSLFTYGLIGAIQLIAREFPIFFRERMVNLGIVPYVLSKITVIAPLALVAIVEMLAILRLTDRLPDAGLDVYLPFAVTLFLVAAAGMSVALMTSAAVRTATQATDLLSLWIIPQVLFSGVLITVESMNSVGRALSNITIMRWGFEAVGRIVDVTDLLRSNRSPIAQSLLLQYDEAFSGDYTTSWLILAGFIVVPLVIACVVLYRKSRNT